jgi:hypothetical protein
MSLKPQLPANFPPQNQIERDQILEWIREIPLVYGPWKAFKRLYKDAENTFLTERKESEIFTALLCRIDAQTLEGLPRDAKVARTHPTRNGYFQQLISTKDALYACERNELLVFDANQPFNTEAVFRLKLARNFYAASLFTAGENYLIARNSQGEGILYSIENPLAPQQVTTFQSPYGNMVYCNGHLVISSNDHVAIYDLPKEQGPLHEIARIPQPRTYNGQIAAQSRYVATSFSFGEKISIIDLFDPQKPRTVGEIAVGRSGFYSMVWRDDLLLVANQRNLSIYKVTASEIKRLSSLNLSLGGPLIVRGDTCFVGGNYYANESTLLDISQPHNPVVIGVWKIPTAQSGVFVGDNYMWLLQNGLNIYDVTEIARPTKIGQPISGDTLRYMKRRGRRMLRMFAEADQPNFWRLAEPILRSKMGRELNLKYDWIGADLLFGRGYNWKHARSGHGDVVRQFTKFARLNREERAPAMWDEHLEFAKECASSDETPRYLLETSRRVLVQNGQTAPAPTSKQLEKLLSSESAAVKVEAARSAIQAVSKLDAKAIASLLWIANQKRRKEILEQIKPNPKLASGLASTLGNNTDIKNGLTKRGREIALLIAARFDLSDPKFTASGALKVIPLLLQSGEAPVRSVGLGFCRRIKAIETLELVQKIENVPQTVRESFVAALEESAATGSFKLEELTGRIRHQNADVRRTVWQLASHSKTSTDVFQGLWRGLFAGLQHLWNNQRRSYEILESAPMQTALATDDALEILSKLKFESYELPSSNLGSGIYSTQLFAALTMVLPSETVCREIATMPDEIWQRNMPLVASHLEKFGVFSSRFWQAVLQGLEDPKLAPALQNNLRTRTFGNPQIARSFGGALGSLSPQVLLSLLSSVEDVLWLSWRSRIIGSLRESASKNDSFWAVTKNFDLSNPVLAARIADDAEFAALFESLDADVWEFDQPAHESLILRWLRTHEISHFETARFATHSLGDVRQWALSQLQILGLNVPLALKLLESNLRDSMDFAIEWFEKQQQNPVGLALALCDSPRLETREYGRRFVQERLEILIKNGFLEAIQENPNAEMQAFVADLLLKHEVKSAPEFDRAVLRGRNRARRAKALVQKRLVQSATLQDDRTLLELARGKTPRDADFALTQLAKRAMDGEKIEGVEVAGVGGI